LLQDCFEIGFGGGVEPPEYLLLSVKSGEVNPSIAFSYTPLSVIRPRMDNRQHDNFWSLRVSVARRSNNR
jgi:hypothetical protein